MRVILGTRVSAVPPLSIFMPCAFCQGTTLIINLSSVLKDETVWEKPHRFHPEHFLDAQGNFVKHEAFMPFSAGTSGGPDSLSIPRVAGRVELQSSPRLTELLSHHRPQSMPGGAPGPHGALPLLHLPPAALQLLGAGRPAPAQHPWRLRIASYSTALPTLCSGSLAGAGAPFFSPVWSD